MAYSTMMGTGDIGYVANYFAQQIQQGSVTGQLSDRLDRTVNGVPIITMVFEKYYMRSSNYASLTVVLSSDGSYVYADLIGAGGSSGLIRFSWFTEESFVQAGMDILGQLGFGIPNQ